MTIITNRRAERARATLGRPSAFTRHALALLTAISTHKNCAEAHAQLEEKAMMDILMSSNLEECLALSTADEGQASASCKGSQVGVRRSP